MLVDLINTNICLFFLHNIFYTVQIFDLVELVDPLKNRLIICQFTDDLFSANVIVNIDFQLDSTKSAFLPPYLT